MRTRVLVTLEQSDVDKLDAYAERYGIPRSALLRLMIRSWKPLDIPGARQQPDETDAKNR